MPEVTQDSKENASRTFADVVRRTRNNFPDARFHPCVVQKRTVNEQSGIAIHGYLIDTNNDGTGTKPELAERMFTETGDPRFFEKPAFDLVAMVADDVARTGAFVLGINNNLDVNSSDDPEFIAALARGMERACNHGRFPLLNGETAGLGYRTPGWGKHRLNWNAGATQLINPAKLIDGSGLRAGQPIVALRETSIRSNGLTRARAILENAYLQRESGKATKRDAIAQRIRRQLNDQLSHEQILAVLDAASSDGIDIWEYMQVPWHRAFPELTEQLMAPSTIYAPVMYAAQGGVDGEVDIPLVACAHVSGGGIPLKAKRMVEGRGVGVHVDAVFPNPAGIDALINLAQEFPHPTKGPLVDERSACEQWNGGVGFLCVAQHRNDADDLVALAASMGYEAAIAGETIDRPAIEWRGHTWTY